jgi:peroxiredoxin
MRYAVLLIAIFFVFACSSSAKEVEQVESPNIQLNINGLSGGWVYLVGHFADQRFKVDSTQADASGNLSFVRDEPYDPGFYFFWIPDQALIQVIIDKDQRFSMSTALNDVINNMQVTDNIDNELLYQNLKFENQISPKFDQIKAQMSGISEGTPEFEALKAQQEALLQQRKDHLNNFRQNHPNSFFTIFKIAGQNPEVQNPLKKDGTLDTALQVYLYRTAFWDNVDFSDERLIRTPVIANKLKRYIKELTPQNPDSIRSSTTFLMNKVMDATEYYKFFANWITLQYDPLETTLMDPEAVYVHMIQNYFTYDKATWSDSTEIYALQLRAKEMEGSLLGNKAPNVVSTGPDGKTYSIDEIKTAYVVVYMYNPTCEHCMEQTPKLVQNYPRWKSQGIEVFAIAVDTEEQEWKDYIRKSNMNFINVFDPTNRSIYAKYYVDHTPEVYVLNPDRIIIAKNLKIEQVDEVIERDRNKRG